MLVRLSLPENNPVDYARSEIDGSPSQSHSDSWRTRKMREGERLLAGISMSLTAKMVAGEQAGGTS